MVLGQVRDVLFIDDLVDCYVAAIDQIDRVSGMTFNVGGGPTNTLSLLELLEMLRGFSGRAVEHRFDHWRPGDQPLYVSDISRAGELIGWQPRINVADGVERLYRWVLASEALFARGAARI